MELQRVNVTTRDAYKPAQEPVSFEWKGKRHRIVEILDQWYEGHMDSTRLPLRYFKVKTHEGLVFILRHHEFFGAWSLLVCKSPLKE